MHYAINGVITRHTRQLVASVFRETILSVAFFTARQLPNFLSEVLHPRQKGGKISKLPHNIDKLKHRRALKSVSVTDALRCPEKAYTCASTPLLIHYSCLVLIDCSYHNCTNKIFPIVNNFLLGEEDVKIDSCLFGKD